MSATARLQAVRPPVFDNAYTRGLFDPTTAGVLRRRRVLRADAGRARRSGRPDARADVGRGLRPVPPQLAVPVDHAWSTSPSTRPRWPRLAAIGAEVITSAHGPTITSTSLARAFELLAGCRPPSRRRCRPRAASRSRATPVPVAGSSVWSASAPDCSLSWAGRARGPTYQRWHCVPPSDGSGGVEGKRAVSTTKIDGEIRYDHVRSRAAARPVPGVPADAGGGTALLQRGARLLRPQPLRRRRGAFKDHETFSSAKSDILELIKTDDGAAVGRVHLRGPAAAHGPPRHPVPGLHAEEDAGPRAADPRVLRRRARSPRRHRPARLRGRPRRQDADEGDRHAARHPRGGPGGVRVHQDNKLRRRRASPAPSTTTSSPTARSSSESVDRRNEHPSDDLMTALIQAEFEDETGTTRRLTRDELLIFLNILATAGNETTNRVIGWSGKLLADHPDQRRRLVEDRSLIPNAVEEILRYQPRPSSRADTSPATSSSTARPCPRAAP